MFVVLITGADFVQPQRPGKDGKPETNPDYSDKEVRAIVSAEVYGNTAQQHELLDFLFNAQSAEHYASTAILANGHEGLTIRLTASAEEYKEYLETKDERQLEEKAARGDVAAQSALNSLRAKRLEAENAAVAASAPEQGQGQQAPSSDSNPKVN